jgi:hypothetical protein
MGDPDPSYLINSETNRIPSKSSPMNLDDWNQTFRSWPNVTIEWKNWYHRMLASKRADWDQYDIGQCITLSLSNMDRNKPMLIAASYFWSNVLNAFLFGHRLMTPTLANIVMLTGLDVTP